MQKYDLLILGGGIAGLTVAHELSKYNLKIALIEKDTILGGMARSNRNNQNIPNEHSWRGYGPFYYNTYQIMKEIKDGERNVIDNLKGGINFILAEDKINNDKSIKITDYYNILYWMYYNLFSGNKRTEKNKELSFGKLINDKISNNAKNLVLKQLGPGLGLDPWSASLFHVGKFYEFTLDNNNQFKFTTKPTNEAWIDPWYNKLKSNVDFYLENEVIELVYDEKENKVSKVITNKNTFECDNVCIALNPYNVVELYKNEKIPKDPEIEKFKSITKGAPHIQISFRIGFNEKINMGNRDAIILADSKLNITFYQQDLFWEEGIDLGNNIKSLWSGTACITYEKSLKYPNKISEDLTREQFMEEVLYEFSICEEINQYLLKYNNKNFKDLNIIYKDIWYEWKYNGKYLEPIYKKWVNTISNNNRPKFTTNIPNLFIAGSHCDTTFSIWSMESAVESGKWSAKEICKKLNINEDIYIHSYERPLKFIHKLDDFLYESNLPNIPDIIIFLVVIISCIIVYFIVKWIIELNKKN